jgi:hypothetical protein
MYPLHTFASLFPKRQSDMPEGALGAVRRETSAKNRDPLAAVTCNEAPNEKSPQIRALPNRSLMPEEDQNTKRYLKRAAELRELASRVKDPESREALTRAAEAYERLANWKHDSSDR